MKGKILDLTIVLFIVFIIAVSVYIIYQYVSFESYTVKIELNGADNIEVNDISCDASLKGCIVTLPNVFRNNANVLGYNLGNNDTIARYKAGDKLLIDEDITLYAITYREKSLKIEKNNIDFIENDSIVCSMYNEETSCKVTLPRFNKIGYGNIGYSTSTKNSGKYALTEYLPNAEYSLNDNVDVLYPKYETLRSPYSVNNLGLYHTNFLEVSTNSSSSNTDTFKKYLDEIYINAPYLYTDIKINILDSEQFNKAWGHDSILGVTYRSTQPNPTKFGTVDVKYDYSGFNSSNIYEENYHTIVHEMVHAWDSYYAYLLKGVSPKDIDKSNESVHSNQNYFSSYENGRISGQKDIMDLYGKYSSSNKISSYAYTNYHEFVAEIFSFYYLKYIVPTGRFVNVDYPDDIKKVVEKYICIAKNNYHNKGCS